MLIESLTWTRSLVCKIFQKTYQVFRFIGARMDMKLGTQGFRGKSPNTNLTGLIRA
jgi:hypothetical protein